MMPTEVLSDQIMQLAFGFWSSKALLSAAELGLFTELAQGPASLDALSHRLNLHKRASRDFLDALVALGMLVREGDVYSNTAECDLFLDRAKPTYIGGALETANARLYGFWGNLTDALRTGKPQNEAQGNSDLFTELYNDPNKVRRVVAAMSGFSRGAAQSISAQFPWKDYGTFVDVGTAQGMVPVTLAAAHPHLRGAGADLPQVKPVFEDFVAQRNLSDRVAFHACDFFKEDLPKADVIIMGHVLHDWDLDQKRYLIAKAYAAVPKGGALIVYEMLIDDERRKNAFGLLMSLNMLVMTNGGFDYTGADCQGWMREAGFSNTRVEPLAWPESMVIGVK
jgi:hypothetical protein